MVRAFFPLSAVACAFIISSVRPARAENSTIPSPARSIRETYLHNCATCHGATGDGNGPSARHFSVKPRNFLSGVFKFQSTPSGQSPLTSDVLRTIGEGLPGTSMIGWKYLLPERDRQALAEYVLAFTSLGARSPSRPVTTPNEPIATPEMIERGREAYRQDDCWECHGVTGEGNGPKSVGLRDQWGQEIVPTNFRLGRLKRGNTPSDTYLTITLGVNGTPMPSFEDAINEEDRWALAFYIRSLRQTGFWAWIEDL